MDDGAVSIDDGRGKDAFDRRRSGSYGRAVRKRELQIGR